VIPDLHRRRQLLARCSGPRTPVPHCAREERPPITTPHLRGAFSFCVKYTIVHTTSLWYKFIHVGARRTPALKALRGRRGRSARPVALTVFGPPEVRAGWSTKHRPMDHPTHSRPPDACCPRHTHPGPNPVFTTVSLQSLSTVLNSHSRDYKARQKSAIIINARCIDPIIHLC
jgi:hypothetical protein